MNIKRIAAIALSNRDFDSFDGKLAEACRWVSLAAGMGCDIAVLPETMNLWCGDGPGNPRHLRIEEVALDDWQTACDALLDCAAANKIAVTVPIYVREHGRLHNASYLVGADGGVLGRYTKQYPTTGEVADGVIPDTLELIPWQGLRVGGGICFDLNFADLFERQVGMGADVILCPSLFPGGEQMNHVARQLMTPIAIAYPAWSRVIDSLGRDIAAVGYRCETLRFGFGVPLAIADINFDSEVFHFDFNQLKIEDILRRHGKDVWLDFDQDNCRFRLESRSPDLTIDDVVKEFDLKRVRQHLVKPTFE